VGCDWSVSLHGFQELVRKYARGKNTPSNYQLQVVHMQCTA
jgi:hypothetical protein